VLLEATRSLVSTGTECICLGGEFEPDTGWSAWVKYPFRPGYSFVGRVIQVGPDVAGLKVGDRVTINGSHCQYLIATATNCQPIPDGVTDEQAAWGTLAYITQHGVRKAKLRLGDVVVVVGLGMLGQLVVQYARAAGAAEVIGIDMVPRRLEMAAAHGATATIARPAGEAREEIKRITGGRLPDVVFDMTGHPEAFTAALKLPRKFGKIVLVGDVARPSEQRMAHEFISRDLKLIGAYATNPPPAASDWAGHWTPGNMMQLFFTLLLRGQIAVDHLVTHRFDPRKAEEAYGLLTLRRAEAMGVIFDWTKL
jgi:2-desacetyl-2-hydroxyethyl bacteriochlorophyllide A dehydrogenase